MQQNTNRTVITEWHRNEIVNTTRTRAEELLIAFSSQANLA